MKYIVHNEEVSRDIYYFCEKAKEENKKFVLLNFSNSYDVAEYINSHDDYDYYININEMLTAYYTKGKATINEWYEKDKWTKDTPENLEKRYQKSKFKDKMSFEDWHIKNGWIFRSSTTYETVSHDIPTVDDFVEEIQIRLFSVKVNNEDAVKTLNELRDEHRIEYVLRNDYYTEIIYRDGYKEIKEDE